MVKTRYTESERILQISNKGLRFFGWGESGYVGVNSDVGLTCTCGSVYYTKLRWVVNGTRKKFECDLCRSAGPVTERSALERIRRSGLVFIRWSDGAYDGRQSNFESVCAEGHVVASSILKLAYRREPCDECVKNFIPTERSRIEDLEMSGVTFVSWLHGYENARSRAIVKCGCGNTFQTSHHTRVTMKRNGCKRCAKYGFNFGARLAFLYVLRSECGSMVKVGITADLKSRMTQLKCQTPFNFDRVELIESSPTNVWSIEKSLKAKLADKNCNMTGFNGATEWFRYDRCVEEIIRSELYTSSAT